MTELKNILHTVDCEPEVATDMGGVNEAWNTEAMMFEGAAVDREETAQGHEDAGANYRLRALAHASAGRLYRYAANCYRHAAGCTIGHKKSERYDEQSRACIARAESLEKRALTCWAMAHKAEL